MRIYKTKTIYLIRHAQTGGNVEGNWLGARSTNPINEYGLKQARDTARTLLDLSVNASKIFSSPTRRALDHAEVLQRRLGLPIEKINSLTEINLGILEDRSREEGKNLVPEEVIDWNSDLTKFKPPLGESAFEALERFSEMIELISENYQKEDIVIVSHGVVIKLFLALILGAQFDTAETKIDVPWTTHGSITIVKFFEDHFRFVRIIENKYPDSPDVAAFG